MRSSPFLPAVAVDLTPLGLGCGHIVSRLRDAEVARRGRNRRPGPFFQYSSIPLVWWSADVDTGNDERTWITTSEAVAAKIRPSVNDRFSHSRKS
jgi:hypothetical protein